MILTPFLHIKCQKKHSSMIGRTAPQMGARPMARIIQENIKKPLADELLFGQLKGGGLVTVDLSKDKKLTFKYKNDKPGKKTGKPSEKVN